jgi:D-threo-aldose 1-dehydrogenase
LSESAWGQATKLSPRREIAISSKVGYEFVPIRPDELEPALWDKPPPFRADFDYSRDIHFAF